VSMFGEPNMRDLDDQVVMRAELRMIGMEFDNVHAIVII